MKIGIKDESKYQQGCCYQKKARPAFEASDFEEAFYLYKEAEKLFREAFDFPETRVFFNQNTALRCLEALIDSGRFDFYDTYQKEAKLFFKEWPYSKINTTIDYHARRDAYAFREWRKSSFSERSEFHVVNAAIEQGDFPGAKRILNDLIAKLKGSSFPESDAYRAIARSKLQIITARKQFKKHEDERDISIIADAYTRAARASQLPKNSKSKQHERIEAHKNWY
ncbi:MAG: hypothetical protein ABIL62_14805, partial [Planctomycetota bacterium]